MLIPDVNVFVYAQREELPNHVSAKAWLEATLSGNRPVGIFEPTLVSCVRIVTNKRIFTTPTPIPIALAFINAVRSAPAVQVVVSSSESWSIFGQLCEGTPASGDDVPDAYLASIAIAHGADLVSTDKGFARFKTLAWRTPF